MGSRGVSGESNQHRASASTVHKHVDFSCGVRWMQIVEGLWSATTANTAINRPRRASLKTVSFPLRFFTTRPGSPSFLQSWVRSQYTSFSLCLLSLSFLFTHPSLISTHFLEDYHLISTCMHSPFKPSRKQTHTIPRSMISAPPAVTTHQSPFYGTCNNSCISPSCRSHSQYRYTGAEVPSINRVVESVYCTSHSICQPDTQHIYLPYHKTNPQRHRTKAPSSGIGLNWFSLIWYRLSLLSFTWASPQKKRKNRRRRIKSNPRSDLEAKYMYVSVM